MATALTATQFITRALRLGGNAVEDINDDSNQAIVWLNESIINRHSEVCELINKWESNVATVNSDGYTIDLPSDWDRIAPIQLFYDENYQTELDSFEVKWNKIWVESQEPANRTIYMRYRKEPNTYSGVSDTVVETANPRLLSILTNEFMSLFLATDNDLETSSAEANTKNKANANS